MPQLLLLNLKRSLLSTAVLYDWSHHDPDIYANSMIATDKHLYVAGPPAIRNESTPEATRRWLGLEGGSLWCLATEDGRRVAAKQLPSPPVHEGMAAANGKLYMALQDGTVICLDKK